MAYYEEKADLKPPTARELEVLGYVAQGKQNKEVARTLRIKESTVEKHLIHLFPKIGVSNRTEAAIWARENDML